MIEFDFPFRLLKVLAKVSVVFQRSGNLAGGGIGKRADGRVRQLDSAEFLERLGGKAIRP